MAPPLPIVYFLVLLALFAAALVAHLHSTTISLPLAPLSIPTILLPLLAGLNSYLHAHLTSHLFSATHIRDPATRRRRRRALALVRTTTQSLQGAFAIVLATLLLQRVVPNQILGCSLEDAWQRMWMAHDAVGIRGVEEALHCCGFRSVRDRAWPFPRGQEGRTDTCVERMGYVVPCEGPWRGQLQRSAGGDFAIVVIVCLMQIGNILVHARYFGRLRPWFSESGPLLLPADDEDDDHHRNNPRRPLLPPSTPSDRRHHQAGNGYVGRIIEEDDSGQAGGAFGNAGNTANAGGRSNGGPGRVVPSGLAAGVGSAAQGEQVGNVWAEGRRRSSSSSSGGSD